MLVTHDLCSTKAAVLITITDVQVFLYNHSIEYILAFMTKIEKFFRICEHGIRPNCNETKFDSSVQEKKLCTKIIFALPINFKLL